VGIEPTSNARNERGYPFKRTGDLLASIYFQQAWAMRSKPARRTKRYERPEFTSDADIVGLGQLGGRITLRYIKIKAALSAELDACHT